MPTLQFGMNLSYDTVGNFLEIVRVKRIIHSFKKMSSNLFPRLKRLSSLALGLFAGLGLILFTQEVQAAERVILKYSFLRESVSVSELTQLVETGKASPSLRSYLRLANRSPEDLRSALMKSVDVNGVTLHRVLNSLPGEIVLDQVSNVIHTPGNRANRQALRSAIVTSALDDNNVTILELLQNYPTDEVHVEGERLVETYQKINRVVGRLPLRHLPNIRL